jgi:hypothetical protein
MTSKCPNVRAAVIAREAKKMELESALEHVKVLREEHKKRIQEVKDMKELFKSGKATAGPRLYKDNSLNRKLGRVGQTIPSNKKATASAAGGSAKEAKATTQRFYADNAANRKLGRALQPIPSKKKKVIKALVVTESPKAVAKVIKALVVTEGPKAVAKEVKQEDVIIELNQSVSSDNSGSDSDSSTDEF